jgi:hypothetical protein
VAAGDEVHLSSASETLHGLLDEVRIYDRALSASQIRALANGEELPFDNDINVAGDFVRHGGVFNGGLGTVRFDGTSTQVLDIDAFGVRFHNVAVDSDSTLVVERDFKADGALTNDGTMQQTRDIPAGGGGIFLGAGGYGGVHISNQGAGGNMGATTVTIKGNQDCTEWAGETVRRCFDIAPSNPPGALVALRLHFSGNELSGHDCDTLDVYRWDGSVWDGPLPLEPSQGYDGRVCPGEASEPYFLQVYTSEFSPFILKSGAPCVDPVVPANASISLAGSDVVLAWDDDPANGGYVVHRDTDPYFVPGGISELATLPGGSAGYTDLGAAGSPGTDYFYAVLGINGCGAASGFEKRLGSFNFGLVPGD